MMRALLPMKTCFFSLLLCSFVALCGTTASAQSGGDAGDTYLRGYTLKNESEQLEAAGKVDAALAGYKQAFQIISGVAQNSPNWQPEVVQYRLKVLQQKIETLQLKSGTAAVPVVPSPASTTTPNTPAPPTTVGAEPPTNDPFEMLRRKQAQQDATIRGLTEQNEILRNAYTGALTEKQKAQQDLATLMKQQDLLRQQIAGAEQAIKAATASSKAEAKAQIEAAQQELKKLRGEQKMVQEMIAGKNTALDDVNKTLAETKKTNETLAAQNKDLQGKVSAFESSGMKSDDLKKLVTENTRLKQELDAARKQVDDLKTSATKKDTEIAQLKTSLSSIQSQLMQLRTENTESQKQVADLTLKLKEMNATLAQNSAAAKSGAKNAKLAEENNMLRTIILRQLRQQERQRQAKELVIAEMKHLENASQTMKDNLEEMTSAKIIITMDEENLFSEPERNQIYAANAVRATTLMVDSGKTQAEKNKPLAIAKEAANNAPNAEEKLLQKAGAALDKGDFNSAEASLQDALRANPKNVGARTSLASLKLRLNKFDEAEVELKKCLVYDPDNDVALYYLGVCYYDQAKMDDAAQSFEKSLAQKADNAAAHHYLGIIASKGGKRDRAEVEFKQSLAIDPNYGDAHFNLAVLYATSEPPNADLAKQHYQSALDRGIKPDASMEKLFKKAEDSKPKTSAAIAVP